MTPTINIHIDESLESNGFLNMCFKQTFIETIDFLFDGEIQSDFIERQDDAILTLCDAKSDESRENESFEKVLPISIDNQIGNTYSKINSFQLPKDSALGSCEEKKQLAQNLTFAILSKLGIGNFHSRIFISYKRQDTEQLALDLYKRLTAEKLGFEVFLDTRKLDVGAEFMDDIRLTIAESDVFILLDSKGYWGKESIFTRQELYTAMYSGVGIIRLYNENEEATEIAKAFDSLLLQQKNEILDKEFVDFVNTLNNKRVPYLKAKMERINNIRKKFISNDLWSYKSNNEEIVCPIVGVPTSQRIEELEKKINDKSKTSFSILYDHWILPQVYNNHIKWIVNEKKINILTLQHVSKPQCDFHKPIVFLSASLSSDESYNFTKVYNIIVTLVEEVINRNGVLVFGGHPSITPIIANMLNVQKNTFKGKNVPNIYLYQSKWFPEDIRPNENKEFPAENIINTIAGKEVNDSLTTMREKMLTEKGPFSLGLFIGGVVKENGTCGRTCGIWDECKSFHEKYPNAKCIAFTNTGTNVEEINKHYNPDIISLDKINEIYEYFL